MQHSKEVDLQVTACLLACLLLALCFAGQLSVAHSLYSNFSLPTKNTVILCLYARQYASAKGAVRVQNIDPNLLLTSFLPILLFAGAVALEWHTVRRLLSSSLLLAGKHC